MKHLLLALLLAAPALTQAQVNDQYTTFEIGSSHAVLADNVNVRKTADASAPVVTKLPIGAWLTIIEAGKPLTMNGIEANWYKVGFTQEGKQMNGFVWGGLIAAETDTSLTDPNLHFHFGLSKVVEEDEGATNTLVQVRAERDHKEVARLEFDAIGSAGTMHTVTLKSPGGLEGIKDVLEIDFSEGFCGGGFGQAYIAWTGSAFLHMITLYDGFDAPMAYDETIILPSEEGGKPGKILFVASSNEITDAPEEGYGEEMKVVEEKTYRWDGKKLAPSK